MCVLAGFPSTPNKSATVTAFPFGIWFADAHTAYIADEDDGYTGGMDLYTHAAAQTTAGLQKWAETATSAPIRTDWSPLRIASRTRIRRSPRKRDSMRCARRNLERYCAACLSRRVRISISGNSAAFKCTTRSRA